MGFFALAAPMLATMGGGTAAATAATSASLAASTSAGLAATAATIAAPTIATGAAGMSVGQMALLGVSAASAIGSGMAQHEAGQAAKAQYKEQARQEAGAARQREIERRRDLISALASQNAAAGAAGVSTRAGTGLAGIAQYDINQTRRDSLVDRVNTGRSRNVLLKAGKNAQTMGNIGAATSLLDSAVDLGRNGIR